VFTELSYAVTPRWTVGGGARYLEEDLTAIDPVIGGILAPPATVEVRNKGSSDELNPSAYVRFKANPASTLYLQYGRGFRSGQVNSILPDECQEELRATGAGSLTEPDTLENYELGVKSRFAGGRLGINTAVFKQKWAGVQLGVQFSCGFSTLLNGGDVSGKGVEFEMDAQATDALRFNLALSYTRNEFDTAAPGSGFSPNERLPEAPEKNASVGAQYNFPLGGTWAGFARADAVHVGKVRIKFATSELTQDSYTAANVRLGMQRDNLGVELFGRNVGDERAVADTQDPMFGGRQTLLRPREVGVEVRYSFR
jgi:outer membrane receptor protein involved in Fe transport